MAAELVADLGLFKTLYESAKALKGMNDPAVRNAAIIEIQEEILAARESQTMLLERVSSLEKEVVDLKHWDAEKKRYKLTDLSSHIGRVSTKPICRALRAASAILPSAYWKES